MNNLAWLYYTERRRLDKAEGMVQRAIILDPDKSSTYSNTLEQIHDAQAVAAAPESDRGYETLMKKMSVGLY